MIKTERQVSGPIPLWALVLAAAAVALLAAVFPAYPQAAPGGAAAPAGPAVAAPAQVSPATGTAKLPKAFRGIALGSDRESVIAALQKDQLFRYRGPEDVSLLPSPNQSLIDVAGLSFVKRAYFQFYEGKLWVMILVLNPDKVDHYSVYTSLVAKYGEPGLLDPKEARWEDGKVRMALERPLTLRYLDLDVFAKLQAGSAARESADELDRRDFLGGL